jgi:hypothetical protein
MGIQKARQQNLAIGKAIRKEPAFLSSGFTGYGYGQAPRATVRGGRVKFGRGRPKGTYKGVYAQYGGVYNYRKAQAFERKKMLLQLQSRANINPQQRAILNQMEAREQARALDPERRIIPDTRGTVNTKSINDEIEDAANAFC